MEAPHDPDEQMEQPGCLPWLVMLAVSALCWAGLLWLGGKFLAADSAAHAEAVRGTPNTEDRP